MERVGLKVMLCYMHVVLLWLRPHEAAEMLRRWSSREYQLKDVRVLTGRTVDGVDFAVDLEQVVGMHTVIPEVGPAAPGLINGSGLPLRN